MHKIGANPFQLDSPRPTITLKDYAYNETRYSSLTDTNARTAVYLLDAAQLWVDARLLAMGP